MLEYTLKHEQSEIRLVRELATLFETFRAEEREAEIKRRLATRGDAPPMAS